MCAIKVQVSNSLVLYIINMVCNNGYNDHRNYVLKEIKNISTVALKKQITGTSNLIIRDNGADSKAYKRSLCTKSLNIIQKQQACLNPVFSVVIGRIVCHFMIVTLQITAAVSYTHLDVYKRQSL